MVKRQSNPPTLEEVRHAVRLACKGRAIAQVQLFGSLARGGSHPGSDVDLLVDFLPEANAGLLEMGELKEDLEDALGCPVDLLSRRAVERSRNPTRRRSILNNSVTVYAR